MPWVIWDWPRLPFSLLKESWNVLRVIPAILLKDGWLLQLFMVPVLEAGRWVPICATGWKHVCLLVSAGTQCCSQMNLWYVLPTFSLLSSPALASRTPEGYLEVVVYASPALSSWLTSLPASQLHPVSLSWAFVFFLFPTGVWPRSKTHFSLHYYHVSTLP